VARSTRQSQPLEAHSPPQAADLPASKEVT